MANSPDDKPRGDATRFYVAVAFGVAALVTAIFAFKSKPDPEGTNAVTRTDGGRDAWCAPGLEAIDGNACFAAPKTKPFPIVIYLHGLHTPATLGEEQERQARVAKRAVEKGFGVLAFHGEKGACSNPELVDTWCWPSNERTAERAANVIAEWAPALATAKDRGATAQKYLFGFSNGGYFASLIATRRLLPVDAAVIAHAGAVGKVQIGTMLGTIPPILLETADDDASNGEMIALDAQLTGVKWPHAIVARDGGHTITDWNVDMALTFFKRISSEAWPLNPPLSTRAPRPPRPDGGDSSDASSPDAKMEDVRAEEPLRPGDRDAAIAPSTSDD